MNQLQKARFELVKMMNGIVIPPVMLHTIYEQMQEMFLEKGKRKQFENFFRLCLESEYYPFLAVYDVETVYYAKPEKREDYLLALIDALDSDFVKKHEELLEQSVSDESKMFEMMFYIYQFALQYMHYGYDGLYIYNVALENFCKFACFNKVRPVDGNCMNELIESLLFQDKNYRLYCTYSAIFCGFSYVEEASLPKLYEAMEEHREYLDNENKFLAIEFKRMKFYG